MEISDLRHQLSVAKQAAAEPAALLESQRAKQEITNPCAWIQLYSQGQSCIMSLDATNPQAPGD